MELENSARKYRPLEWPYWAKLAQYLFLDDYTPKGKEKQFYEKFTDPIAVYAELVSKIAEIEEPNLESMVLYRRTEEKFRQDVAENSHEQLDQLAAGYSELYLIDLRKSASLICQVPKIAVKAKHDFVRSSGTEIQDPTETINQATEFLQLNPCQYLKTGQCALALFMTEQAVRREL